MHTILKTMLKEGKLKLQDLNDFDEELIKAALEHDARQIKDVPISLQNKEIKGYASEYLHRQIQVLFTTMEELID